MERIYTVKLRNGASYQARGDEALELKVHEECVIRKEFFFDFGTVVRVGVQLEPGKGGEMPQIQRRPTEADHHAMDENENRCRSAMKIALQMVEHLALPMKLLNAHYSLDVKLLTIQFTAEGRVDFRELVKELSRALCTRIELRQIGVRDETGIYGGIAVCGQQFCCSRFLKEFNSINVKMAKEQDLSLTPATISGACGRLKCCLKFEHEGYLELEKGMPRRGNWCDTPQGRGRVCDRNLLTRNVSVQLETGNVVHFDVSEVTVFVPEQRPRIASERPQRNNGGNNGNGNGNGNGNSGNRDRNPRRNRNDRPGRPAGKPSSPQPQQQEPQEPQSQPPPQEAAPAETANSPQGK